MKKFTLKLTLFASVFLLVSSSVMAFTDVTRSMLYYDSIELLEDEDIIQGYSDGSYGYDKSINRAEFMKILVETKFLNESMSEVNAFDDERCFDDVPRFEWYTKYVCYAEDEGWVEGYAGGDFKPDQDINFVEAMKIVLEVLDVDYDNETPWYRGIVDAAADDNLIPLTIRAFDQKVTRAEMADMIARKIKFDEDELDDFLGDDKKDINVTYNTIAQGKNMAKDFTDPESGEKYYSIRLDVDDDDYDISKSGDTIFVWADEDDEIDIERVISQSGVKRYEWLWWNSNTEVLDCDPYPDDDDDTYRCEVENEGVAFVFIEMDVEFSDGDDESYESNLVYIVAGDDALYFDTYLYSDPEASNDKEDEDGEITIDEGDEIEFTVEIGALGFDDVNDEDWVYDDDILDCSEGDFDEDDDEITMTCEADAVGETEVYHEIDMEMLDDSEITSKTNSITVTVE